MGLCGIIEKEKDWEGEKKLMHEYKLSLLSEENEWKGEIVSSSEYWGKGGEREGSPVTATGIGTRRGGKRIYK